MRIGRGAIQKVVHIRTRLHDIFMRIMLIDSPGSGKIHPVFYLRYIHITSYRKTILRAIFLYTDSFCQIIIQIHTGNVVCIVHPNHLIAFLLKKTARIVHTLNLANHLPFSILFPNQINTVIYPDIHKVRTSCHKLATPGAGNIRHAFYGSAIDKENTTVVQTEEFITYTAKVPDLSAGLGHRTDIRQIAVHLYRIRGVIQTTIGT